MRQSQIRKSVATKGWLRHREPRIGIQGNMHTTSNLRYYSGSQNQWDTPNRCGWKPHLPGGRECLFIFRIHHNFIFGSHGNDGQDNV